MVPLIFALTFILSLNLVMSTVHVVDAGTAGFVYLKTPVYGLSNITYSGPLFSLVDVIRALINPLIAIRSEQFLVLTSYIVLCVTNSSHSRRWLRDTNFAMYCSGDSRHFNRMPSLCMINYRFCVTQQCNCQKVYAVTGMIPDP